VGPVTPSAPVGPVAPSAPVGPVILGKQTAFLNAALLNCFGLGIDFDVFHDPAQLVGEFKLYANIAVLMDLDMVYKLNQDLSCQFVYVFRLSERYQEWVFQYQRRFPTQPVLWSGYLLNSSTCYW
jgi:hypothetical protein